MGRENRAGPLNGVPEHPTCGGGLIPVLNTVTNRIRSVFGSSDGDGREIMWRSVGIIPCDDGSSYVVQQMVGFENGIEKPYDAHRTIHIDAAQGGLRRVEDLSDEEPEKWAKPREQWNDE